MFRDTTRANIFSVPDFHDLNTWKNSDYVYIGRQSPLLPCKESRFHNPYDIETYGRDLCLEMYQDHFIINKLDNYLYELREKILCCWCEDQQSCHADYLINQIYKQYETFIK